MPETDLSLTVNARVRGPVRIHANRATKHR
jgi:hypothetical protein